MQDTFDLFDHLPYELQWLIAQYLSDSDLISLARVSKSHLGLFKPMIDIRKLLQLLHCVVHGKHDRVQWILKDDINLIFKRGKVTDCSGREFENVSGFEYALWALDKHMWAKMIACVPSNEKGKEIFAKLLAQYNKVNTTGVTYKLNGKTITENHFDFENTIIKELQTQIDLINTPDFEDIIDAIYKQWKEGVGGAQAQLPMHAVDEYGSNEPFSPVPEFKNNRYHQKNS